MAKLLNRVAIGTATTGTGTMTLGAAISGLWVTPAQAGIVNGDEVTYCITEGSDFELGRGVYSSTGPTLTRAAVLMSKIGGTVGTTKMTLAGAAQVVLTAAAEDIPEYAKGLFTPVFTFATPGDLSVSYALQAGFYTRIGNRVFFDYNITFTPTFTTASGQGIFQGLQIPALVASGGIYSAAIGQISNLNPASGDLQITARILSGATSLLLFRTLDSAPAVLVTAAHITSGVAITLCISGNYPIS